MRPFALAALLLFSLSTVAAAQHPQKHKAATTSPTPTASPTPEALNATAVRTTAGFLVLGFAMYWIPTIVALSRKHHNRGAITITNLLLGWTIIGWIAALIWACTNPPAAAAAQGAGR